MAARAGRAVRVDPGTASDRRGTVGTSAELTAQKLSVSSSPKHGRFRFLQPEPVGILNDLNLAGGRATNLSLGRPTGQQRPLINLRAVKNGVPFERKPQAVPSALEPFSVLYELEHHRGAFVILFLIYREGTVTKSRMRERLKPGPEALDGAIGSLTRLGLVKLDSSRRFPFAKTYRLTDYGRTLLDLPLSSWPSVFLR